LSPQSIKINVQVRLLTPIMTTFLIDMLKMLKLELMSGMIERSAGAVKNWIYMCEAERWCDCSPFRVALALLYTPPDMALATSKAPLCRSFEVADYVTSDTFVKRR
jgi:hypothetical protein